MITCTSKGGNASEPRVEEIDQPPEALGWLVGFDFGDGGHTQTVVVEDDTAEVEVYIPKDDETRTYVGPRAEMELLLQAAYAHLLLTRQPDAPVSDVETRAAAIVPNASAVAELSRLWAGEEIVKGVYLTLLGEAEPRLRSLPTHKIMGMVMTADL